MAYEPISESTTEDIVPNEYWKCGDSFKYPLPKEEGDPWRKVLTPLIERDKEQCEVWKAEVENLLIFAGLISAVITSFIIESYKGLQPDPNDDVVALLSRIALSLENPANISSLPTTLPSEMFTTPSAAISRVNIMWFISLVLSLTVVLVGTVALQWLREHQRYPGHNSPKDTFAVFNMRREGLQDWFVPQMFLIMPMLLQVALILFFVGLIDFLLLVAPSNVSTPPIVIIGLPILFLVLTTVIPSLQWILSPSVFVLIFRRVPSQCPYKSPQSSVFNSIITPTIVFVSEFFLSLLYVWSKGVDGVMRFRYWWQVCPKPVHFDVWHNLSSDDVALFHRERSHVEIYKNKLLATFAPRPDVMFSMHDLLPMGWEYDRIPPIYDWIIGLKSVITEANSRQQTLLTGIYHCIQEVSTMKFDEGLNDIDEGWNQYIQNILAVDRQDIPILSLAQLLANGNATSVITAEETSKFITDYFWQSPEITVHAHELYLRLANQHVGKPLQRPKIKLLDFEEMDATSVPMRFVSPQTLALLTNKVETEVASEISWEYTKSLSALLTVGAVQVDTLDMDLLDIISFYSHVIDFLGTALCNQTTGDRLSTLRLMEAQAHRYLLSDRAVENPHQLLFFLVASYVAQIVADRVSALTFEVSEISAAKNLIPLLGRYQGTIKADPDRLEKVRMVDKNYSDFCYHHDEWLASNKVDDTYRHNHLAVTDASSRPQGEPREKDDDPHTTSRKSLPEEIDRV